MCSLVLTNSGDIEFNAGEATFGRKTLGSQDYLTVTEVTLAFIMKADGRSGEI